MKANRMHLIYAPGSVYTHTIDYKAIIITSAKRKESIKDFITKPNVLSKEINVYRVAAESSSTQADDWETYA